MPLTSTLLLLTTLLVPLNAAIHTVVSGTGYHSLPSRPAHLDMCTDPDGNTRRVGEEWTVRNHFVMLCHDIAGSMGRTGSVMKAENIACLGEDGVTRMAVGESVEEMAPMGEMMRLVCWRDTSNGQVRRSWRPLGGGSRSRRRVFKVLGANCPLMADGSGGGKTNTTLHWHRCGDVVVNKGSKSNKTSS